METTKTAAQVGAGIVSSGVLPENNEEPYEDTQQPELATVTSIEQLRQEMRQEFDAAVADVEFRLAQQYEILRRQEQGSIQRVYVEDIFDMTHRLTGYTLTNNSPALGSIAWASLHVVFMGVDYTITDGNTANKYAWFVKPGSGTTASLSTGNALPVLGPNDALIFVNNGGVASSAIESSLPPAVAPGSITQASFANDVAALLTNMQSDIDNAQATADGAIVSYFQNDPPWANGTVQDPAKVGDVWYDANDGGAFRWSGAGGSPANTWIRIADTDTSAIAALVNTKITTYIGTTAPAAPSGGFTTGDIWIDTSVAGGNVTKRWSGPGGSPANSWVAYQLGDGALSGISGAKVGTGINGSNVTTGTVVAARIGAGVNGAVLNTATGTVGNSQIANNAVQPKNINAAFHLLY